MSLRNLTFPFHPGQEIQYQPVMTEKILFPAPPFKEARTTNPFHQVFNKGRAPYPAPPLFRRI